MISNTPLLKSNTNTGNDRRIFAKAEYYNLSGSIKDRVAFHILKKAYESHAIQKGNCIAEATSGNTGIAFSAMGSYLGHKVVIYMPDWMSRERIHWWKAMEPRFAWSPRRKAAFRLNPNDGGAGEARKCVSPPAILQWGQCRNPLSYYWWGNRTSALRPGLKSGWNGSRCGNRGTVMGIGKRLREENPSCKVYPPWAF